MKTINVLLLGLLTTASLHASDINLKKCMGCHGQNFEKAALGKSKIVKDMSQAEIAGAISGYQAGTYGGKMKGLMKGQVSRLNKADIIEVAEYISSLKTK